MKDDFKTVDLEGQLGYSDEALRVEALQAAALIYSGQGRSVQNYDILNHANAFYIWLKAE